MVMSAQEIIKVKARNHVLGERIQDYLAAVETSRYLLSQLNDPKIDIDLDRFTSSLKAGFLTQRKVQNEEWGLNRRILDYTREEFEELEKQRAEQVKKAREKIKRAQSGLKSSYTKARKELYQTNRSQVLKRTRSWAKKIAATLGLDTEFLYDEFMDVAEIAAWESLADYNPKYTVTTRISSCIDKKILTELAARFRGLISVPRNIANRYPKISEAENQLTEELKRKPSARELTEYFNKHFKTKSASALTPYDIKIYLTLGKQTLDIEYRDGEGNRIYEPTGYNDSPLEKMIANENTNLTQLHNILSSGVLDCREMYVVKSRFGLGKEQEEQEPKTLDAIGKKLGVHRERVRQIERDALTKLAIAMRPEEIDAAVKRGDLEEDEGIVINSLIGINNYEHLDAHSLSEAIGYSERKIKSIEKQALIKLRKVLKIKSSGYCKRTAA